MCFPLSLTYSYVQANVVLTMPTSRLKSTSALFSYQLFVLILCTDLVYASDTSSKCGFHVYESDDCTGAALSSFPIPGPQPGGSYFSQDTEYLASPVCFKTSLEAFGASSVKLITGSWSCGSKSMCALIAFRVVTKRSTVSFNWRDTSCATNGSDYWFAMS